MAVDVSLRKKGMTQALTVVVACVVLIVVALAVITVAVGGINNFYDIIRGNTDTAGNEITKTQAVNTCQLKCKGGSDIDVVKYGDELCNRYVNADCEPIQ